LYAEIQLFLSGKITRMTKFWLVRHGETDWNREGLYQGQADIPLNEMGLTQARSTAEKLLQSGQPFSAIYSSPLRRALQTAEQTASLLGMLIFVDHRLKEINQGDWTGKSYRDLVAQYGAPLTRAPDNPISNVFKDTVYTRAPGGESVAEVAFRMAQAADDISSAHPDQAVLVFSHGLASATVHCQAAGIPLEKVYAHIPENGQVLIVDWTPFRKDPEPDN
jgi:broad specificity phosphatase PhoE